MSASPQPSAEAISVAVKLSGHTHCQKALTHGAYRSAVATAMLQDEDYEGLANEVSKPNMVCDNCLGDAATIDDALQLPQRNAALLLAQGIADSFDQWPTTRTQIEELRDALAAIRKAK